MTTITPNVQRAINKIKTFCNGTGGRSKYFAFGGEGYKSSVRHFLESSAEIAAGAVQPGSAADVAAILNIIAEEEAPFAVKGGGHATNPGFSSTTGIQIYMCNFNKVDVVKDTDVLLPPNPPHPSHSIVHIGAGCLFDEVYREVVRHDLNIVGGSSIGGVGIAGWLLGGGYSLKTNQHGLGIDNILQVEVVIPPDSAKEMPATVKTVSHLSTGDDKELFEAIKGGGNNFGIVTEFTVRAHVQTKPTCGCLLQYEVEDYEEVKAAVAKFARQVDPKASIVAAFRYYNNPGGVQSKLTVQCFYDGPRPRDNGPFADFLDIDHKTESGGGDTVGWQSTPWRPAPGPRTHNPLQISLPVESGPKSLPNTDAPPVVFRSKQSELVEYDDYYQFDHRTSLINEVLDTTYIPMEEIRSLAPPVHSAIQAVRTDGSNAAPFATTISAPTFWRSGLSMTTMHSNRSGSMEIFSPSSQNHIKRAMAGIGEHPRGRWGNVMVDIYTKEIIDEIGKQASKAARYMPAHGGKRVVIDIWPFTKGMFDKATECAWPHVKDEPNGPILVYFLWEGSENDIFWIETMEHVLEAIKKKVDKARNAAAAVRAAEAAARAARERSGDAEAAAREAARTAVAKPLPVYMNTTLDMATRDQIEHIYGGNFERLKLARAKFDPGRVMDLAGGFRIPHPPMDVDDDDELYE